MPLKLKQFKNWLIYRAKRPFASIFFILMCICFIAALTENKSMFFMAIVCAAVWSVSETNENK